MPTRAQCPHTHKKWHSLHTHAARTQPAALRTHAARTQPAVCSVAHTHSSNTASGPTHDSHCSTTEPTAIHAHAARTEPASSVLSSTHTLLEHSQRSNTRQPLHSNTASGTPLSTHTPLEQSQRCNTLQPLLDCEWHSSHAPRNTASGVTRTSARGQSQWTCNTVPGCVRARPSERRSARAQLR